MGENATRPTLIQRGAHTMTDPHPKHAELPQAVDDFLSLSRQAQDDEEELSGLLVRGAVLEGEDLTGLTLRDVTFDHCRFPGCDWLGASFTDVTFHTCDLTGGNLDRTFWLRFALTECRAMGLRLQNCRMREGICAETRLSGANFTQGKLRQTVFSVSALNGAFFNSCTFTGVQFRDCDLTQAGFVHTLLKNVDFTTSQIDGLVLSEGCEELRGAIVDLYQAAGLARRLGVVIKE